MSITNRMLDSGTITGRRVLQFGASLEQISGLIERAQQLQANGMRYKLAGDHIIAVAIYRELLGVVRELEEVGALSWPQGMPVQLVERALEIEANGGRTPCDEDYQAAMQQQH